VKFIVNHLTRMQAGYCCVAGIDPATREHVRPVQYGRLSTGLLASEGGVFDIGMLVDLGAVTPRRQPPEVEDHLFDARNLRAVRTLDDDEFWGQLDDVAKDKLRDIFGAVLKSRGATSCGVNQGQGRASLGCLLPTGRPRLYTKPNTAGKPDKVRLELTDGEFSLDLGVTDIRLYKPDHTTPDPAVVADVNRRLQAGVATIISVGLTRAFASSDEFDPVHWLQANNIHLGDDPTWRLA
jgi:hypothetical protein